MLTRLQHFVASACLHIGALGLAADLCLATGFCGLQQVHGCCVQENEAVQEEKKKQLYEEGIDAILARAEVSILSWDCLPCTLPSACHPCQHATAWVCCMDSTSVCISELPLSVNAWMGISDTS